MTSNDGKRQSVNPPASLADTDLLDSSWDDDSGAVPIGTEKKADDIGERVTTIPSSLPMDQYARRVLARAEKDEEDDPLESGMHPRELRRSQRPTPPAGLPIHMPPELHTPDPPLDFGIDLDDPAGMRAPSYDDLSLELGSSGPDPMHAGFDERGDELELDEPQRTEEDPAVGDMRDRYAAGDFTGALILSESLLETDPNHEEALRYADSCREVLTQMYSARLGPLDQVATVAIPSDQIRWLSLDHRAGFLLSLVDGVSTVDEILDISGMTRLDALRIMYTLLEQRIVALEGGSG
jgi:hypothetical protein